MLDQHDDNHDDEYKHIHDKHVHNIDQHYVHVDQYHVHQHHDDDIDDDNVHVDDDDDDDNIDDDNVHVDDIDIDDDDQLRSGDLSVLLYCRVLGAVIGMSTYADMLMSDSDSVVVFSGW